MTAKNKNPAYRYSIIPARAVTDQNITAQALRVLALLGRHTDENGWCRRSQVKMAEELACSRGTIQNALDVLIGPENGQSYVERREETRPGVEFEEGRHPHCSYSYRVRLDLDDEAEASGANRLARVVPTEKHGVPPRKQHGVPASVAPLTEPSPLERPLTNSQTSAAAGENGNVQGLKKDEGERFPDFRDMIAAEWPDGFPATDTMKALKEFERQTRVTPADTLIQAAFLHGVWLNGQKGRRGTGAFFQKHPSNWLREDGWKGYVDEAAAEVRQQAETGKGLAPIVEALGVAVIEKLRRSGVTDDELLRFDGVTFTAGPPPAFMAARPFQASRLRAHGARLQKEFGEGLQIIDAGQRRSA